MIEVDKYSASRPHTCRRPRSLAYVSSWKFAFPLAHVNYEKQVYSPFLLQTATVVRRLKKKSKNQNQNQNQKIDVIGYASKRLGVACLLRAALQEGRKKWRIRFDLPAGISLYRSAEMERSGGWIILVRYQKYQWAIADGPFYGICTATSGKGFRYQTSNQNLNPWIRSLHPLSHLIHLPPNFGNRVP